MGQGFLFNEAVEEFASDAGEPVWAPDGE